MTRREDSESRKGNIRAEEPVRTAEEQSPVEGAPADAPSLREPSPVDQLQKLAAENRDLTNTLVRLQADFDNYRKRVERERHQDRHRGAEALVERLLPVLDAFDRAIASHDDSAYEEYRKGFALIRKHLWDMLAKQGLERIEASGNPFDPRVHHAIERVETDEFPDGTVIEELQAGYSYHGKVLRPAMVRVAIRRSHENSGGDPRVN